MPLIGWIAIAAVVAGVLGWLLGTRRSTTVQVRLDERDRELAGVQANATRMTTDAERLRERLAESQVARERLEATIEVERWAAGERLAAVAKAEATLREAFAALSSQALQANNTAFLELAKASMGEFQQAAKSDLDARQLSIDQLVKPMHEGLQRVDEKLQAFDKERAVSAASLQEHLRAMAEAQQLLTGETQTLVKALRAPQVRGQWGELQLKRVVELAGMQEHCDFTEQHTVQGDEGRLRPDLIVRLPGNKTVVVDSKAPLSAYLDAMEATDDARRGAELDKHASQVRTHVEALSRKDYANEFTESVNFVVMFLPREAFFSAACQRDPSLIEFAISRNVIPASPTTLVTVLKAVHYGWQQERIAKNSEEIRDAALDLYARMRTVGEHLVKIRRGLETAVGAYNSAVTSLESRVLPTARRLKTLGAGQGEEIEVLEPVDAFPRIAAAPELVVEETTVLLP